MMWYFIRIKIKGALRESMRALCLERIKKVMKGLLVAALKS